MTEMGKVHTWKIRVAFCSGCEFFSNRKLFLPSTVVWCILFTSYAFCNTIINGQFVAIFIYAEGRLINTKLSSDTSLEKIQ